MKILVVKTINGFLKPAYDSDYENFAKMPVNETFEIEYTKRRNSKFHRKYFSLLKLAFENQSDYRTLEEMRHDLTIVCGYYNEHVNKITGEIVKKADSISFSSMDNIQFSELYEKTKDVICKWLGIDNQTIDEEIQQYF
jgi:hypothetical protein